ncbi:hypothetical protein MKX01_016804 [Papaver californicum]|nr:hypothetical protein MKX01_016804 [Papaver californicum]
MFKLGISQNSSHPTSFLDNDSCNTNSIREVLCFNAKTHLRKWIKIGLLRFLLFDSGVILEVGFSGY